MEVLKLAGVSDEGKKGFLLPEEAVLMQQWGK